MSGESSIPVTNVCGERLADQACLAVRSRTHSLSWHSQEEAESTTPTEDLQIAVQQTSRACFDLKHQVSYGRRGREDEQLQ